MAREDHARFERLSLQAASQTLEEVVRRVTPEDDGFTDNMLGKPGARELEPETAETLRKKAIEASLKSAHMVGYLRSMARFVIGKGPEFSPVDMPDETTEAISDWWGKFKVINKWDEQIEDEIPLAHVARRARRSSGVSSRSTRARRRSGSQPRSSWRTSGASASGSTRASSSPKTSQRAWSSSG